jgi:NCAIR mutase (PurE)-related protein
LEPLNLHQLAQELLAGTLTTEAFLRSLAVRQTAELEDTTLDLDRRHRCGYPEVIYGEGKSTATLINIVRRLLDERLPILATRVSADKAADLQREFASANYNAVARTFRLGHANAPDAARHGKVAVVTAGTSDLPVAEEARETLDWMGVSVCMIHDCGVAGPQRLPRHLTAQRRPSSSRASCGS